MSTIRRNQDRVQYLLVLTSIALGIAVFCIYAIVSYSVKQENLVASFFQELLPDIFSTLLSVVIVYFVLTRKGINSDESFLILMESNLKLQEEIKATKEKLVAIEKIHSLLLGVDSRFKVLFKYLLSAEPFSQNMITFIMDRFISQIEPFQYGFTLKEEAVSLQSYIFFWQCLSEMQRVKKEAGHQNIIARIVHSSSIHIWTNEHDKYKELSLEIYSWQAEFIRNGGAIVRILIGQNDVVDEDYQKAINEMEEIGIEVKYLPKSPKVRLQYDFLLLHDEKFIVKWKSNQGNAIAECEYYDRLDESVARKWQELFFELDKRNKPIISIPKERQFLYEI
ncbi:MAG: hypothetical protein SFV55_16330 [Haliscomenobacter sp.]|uniref:hypothetical protein n=1 Tax=Haliscomenobacter sp. TaxID=2717303 RepID=UPI0029B6198E|nr:hypothetical protein [Haliscomenobacter sp.]MDX2069995.1 hypothetical protein [Haliscomenobacter sp.]